MELTDKVIANITQLEFKKSNNIHQNTNSIMYIDENNIYKIVDSELFYPKEFERNIDYLINNEIPNTPKIYEKIYRYKKFYGYVMEHIKNSITFKEAIETNIDEQIKTKAIIDIHNALKELHKRNIVLGDIHIENFIISQDDGYLVDLDYMRFPGEENKFINCYDIKPYNSNNKITKSSIYTDIVKTTIASLSLLLKMNLESLTNSNDKSLHLEDIYNTVIIATNNKLLINYFKDLMNGKELYFDDFLKENNYYIEKIKTI